MAIFKSTSDQSAPRAVRLLVLGRRPYREIWELQKSLHAAIVAGEAQDCFLFVEHDPVVTVGRNAKSANLKLTPLELAARGIDYVAVERGGDATYHGPGQLVVYPLLRLERFREVVPLVRKLEGVAMTVCAEFSVGTERWSNHAGVWVGDRQICAIGLAVQKMVSLHGIALNVHTALTYDQLITPCGLPDRGITSLAQERQQMVQVGEVIPAMRRAVETAFNCRLIQE